MNPEEALKQLARAAAEEYANATRAANTMILVELLQLLHQKQVISSAEISSFLVKLDRLAAATATHTPQVSSALAETTLLLRHALEKGPEKVG